VWPSPTIQPQRRAAVVDNINKTLQNVHDLVEERSVQSEGTPALIPLQCIAPTATWWKHYLRRADGGLLHWQFKYTVGAFPFRPRLAHIYGNADVPAARACRNCHSTDETHQHLFIDCATAVTLRQQWILQRLANVALTPAQQLQLWEGVIDPAFLKHQHRTALFKAASAAVTLRRQLTLPPSQQTSSP
jgi:hypothetical protein